MKVRVAQPADAPAVARIHVESWRVAYRGIMPDEIIERMNLAVRTERWSNFIAVREWPVFLLEDGHDVIGFCHLTATRDPDNDPRTVGEITSLHVLPDLRGRGAGRALCQAAFTELRRRGYHACTLWVLERNTAARAFYERLGFRDDGGRKNYPHSDVPEVRYRIDQLFQ
jgi:ribosomal protein S18 acetylase RimI-like enzyme